MSKNDPPFAFFDTLEKMANPFKKAVQLPPKMGDTFLLAPYKITKKLANSYTAIEAVLTRLTPIVAKLSIFYIGALL